MVDVGLGEHAVERLFGIRVLVPASSFPIHPGFRPILAAIFFPLTGQVASAPLFRILLSVCESGSRGCARPLCGPGPGRRMYGGTDEPSWASTRPPTPPMEDGIQPYGYAQQAPSAITLPNLSPQHHQHSPNSMPSVSPQSPHHRTAGALPHVTVGSPRSLGTDSYSMGGMNMWASPPSQNPDLPGSVGPCTPVCPSMTSTACALRCNNNPVVPQDGPVNNVPDRA
jgi:hypothetical protein